ncbi:MAG: FAD:protein FMN transferase [Gammaproteobacteria bacterium]
MKCAFLGRSASFRAILGSLAALTAAFQLSGCASRGQPLELHGEGLGSTWSVKIAGPVQLDLPTVQHGIQQQIDNAAHQLSRWDPSSRLSLLNASPSEDWQTLPPELHAAISYALQLASDTGGAYDPTVAPLVDVWGFGTAGRRFDPPSPEAITAARSHVGWAQITLDPAANRIRRPAGVQIDLSSMAHGFGADQVSNYLRSLGVQRYLVDVGSEIRAQGDSPQGHSWHVAVEQPPPEATEPDTRQRSAASLTAASSAAASSTAAWPAVASPAAASPAAAPSTAASTATEAPVSPSPAGMLAQAVSAELMSADDAPTPAIRVLALHNAAVATSGNYRYFFDYNGRRYSHRIDPRTAAPITHPLASVTVIAAECMHADALATALTVLGPDEGFEYASRHEIAALFIVRTRGGFEQRMTPAFKSYLH